MSNLRSHQVDEVKRFRKLVEQSVRRELRRDEFNRGPRHGHRRILRGAQRGGRRSVGSGGVVAVPLNLELCLSNASPTELKRVLDDITQQFLERGILISFAPQNRAHPVAHDLSEWTVDLDDRRCELIDRKIAGVLTERESAELKVLQQAMLDHRRKVAPLPIEAARQLHRELMAQLAAHSEH